MSTSTTQRMLARTVCLASFLSLPAACGSGSSVAGVTSPSPSSTASGIPVIVAIAVSGGGSYSATFNGQRYTTQPGFSVSLAEGVYEISGTYSGGTLLVGFGSLSQTAGGV